MKIKFIKTRQVSKKMLAAAAAIVISAQQQMYAQANPGTALDSANTLIRSFFGNIESITLAIGGIVGLIGGIRVYSKWNNGDQDVNKAIMGWGGAAIFLALSGTLIKTFFGLS